MEKAAWPKLSNLGGRRCQAGKRDGGASFCREVDGLGIKAACRAAEMVGVKWWLGYVGGVILSATLALGAHGVEPQSFFASLSSDDPKIRLTAVGALPGPGPERSAILSQGLKEPNPSVRAQIVKLIASDGGEGAIPLLGEAARDSEASVRWAAVDALGQSGNPGAAGALVKALKDSDPAIRMNAAKFRTPDPMTKTMHHRKPEYPQNLHQVRPLAILRAGYVA